MYNTGHMVRCQCYILMFNICQTVGSVYLMYRIPSMQFCHRPDLWTYSPHLSFSIIFIIDKRYSCGLSHHYFCHCFDSYSPSGSMRYLQTDDNSS